MKTTKMVETIEGIKPGFIVKTSTKFCGKVFTVVEARLLLGQKVILAGEGIARRSPTQDYDSKIGKDVATFRAIEAIAKKLRRKDKAVHHWSMG